MPNDQRSKSKFFKQSYVQVEPYLYLGMGQVCLYYEAPENFSSSGVDFVKRYKDTWPMDLLSL